MCGRYNLFHPVDEVAARFAAVRVPEGIVPRYNIAPTQTLPIVLNHDGTVLELARWGLVPSWAKDISIGSKMINARAETIAEKPAYKNLLKRRRCIVPSDGFYEWQTKEHGWDGKSPKVPMFIHRPDSALMGLAGIYDRWRGPDGEWVQSYSIVTTQANDAMSQLHDRMPVILKPEDEARWLDPQYEDLERLQAMLVTFQGELDIYPVTPQINKPSFDDPTAILPLPTVNIPTLF